MENTKVRKFTIDPALLFDVIKAQAGTIGKAIAEAVANSLDAGATECQIKLTSSSFSIVDDGRGFGEGEEGFSQIQRFFETFGTPHQAGDSILGRYRMGRGQVFAQGINVWRTGTFKMAVDIQNKGLDYELQTDLPAYNGCTIEVELYQKLTSQEFTLAIREIEELVKFAELPVILNGKRITKNLKSIEWDLETDQAYFKFKDSGGLSLYNLGFLVKNYQHYQYGVGGLVVSKERLDVNFARNDVLVSKCGVFKKIKAVLEQHANREVQKKATLTADDRVFLATKVLANEYSVRDAGELKLVTDVLGRHYKLWKLGGLTNIAVAPKLHDRKGELAHVQGMAFVLAPATLERFGCETIEELYGKLNESHHFTMPRIVPFDQLTALLNDSGRILTAKEIKPEERIALRALNDVALDIWPWVYQITRYEAEGSHRYFRQFEVGESTAMQAWTDGKSWVAIERMLLRQMHRGIDDIMAVLMVVAHEAAHDNADIETHDHDRAFYERFHDICQSRRIGWASIASRIADKMMRLNAEEGRKNNVALVRATVHAQQANQLTAA